MNIDVVSLRGVGDGDHNMLLAWISFKGAIPSSRINVSYISARDLLQRSSSIVGNPNLLAPAGRNAYLGRAMGRALAHELGHYILRSRTHTRKGLMQATWSATDLFSMTRKHFTLTPQQCARVASQLEAIQAIASHQQTQFALEKLQTAFQPVEDSDGRQPVRIIRRYSNTSRYTCE